MKRFTLLIAALTALTSSACLQKDVTSTVYLQQDGSADWFVLERNVRSDEEKPAARDQEEHEYLDMITRDRHGVAEGFRALGASEVRTRLLRDRRPYAAMVEGRFDGLTGILAPVLASCSITHGSDMVSTGGETTWTLWADVGPDGDAAFSDSCGKEFEGILEATEVTIVLASGRFTRAVGFTLEGTDRAMIDEKATDNEALARNNGRLVLSLSWTDGPR